MKEEKEKEKHEHDKRVKELAEKRAKKQALDVIIDDEKSKGEMESVRDTDSHEKESIPGIKNENADFWRDVSERRERE